jgi:hypothetical protein
MKTKHILQHAIILIIAINILGCANTRRVKIFPPLDIATVKNMMDSQNFIFIPLSVNPTSARKMEVGPPSNISISKDTIVSSLPYYGRGYASSLSPKDVDFDFTSTKFSSIINNANNGWVISIKPKDQKYLQELYFKIHNNASASLTITSLDRSSVSFDGYIKERKYSKEKN